jgi:hypothetical protein
MLALAALSFPVFDAAAATIMVGNCNDGGSGSLRAAVSRAHGGDTVDLRRLTCGRILLTSGAIDVSQDDLAFIGPGRFALTVDGNRQGRVFHHTGAGTLRIVRMSVAHGFIEENTMGRAAGGCISARSLVLERSRVHHCGASAPGGLEADAAGGAIAASRVVLSFSSVFASAARNAAFGGGIFADEVVLYRSQVYGNYGSWGGGIYASQRIQATYSLIHGNRGASAGAGVYLDAGDLVVNKSTISANRLDGDDQRGFGGLGGGIMTAGDARVVLADSTVSGNYASEASAALIEGPASVLNSTIAANEADDCGLFGILHAAQLRIESSIVAANVCRAPGFDTSSFDITGSHNLIGSSRNPVPSDTFSANPRLLPLAENGGPVRTHALRSDSPAIDRGSNPLDRAYDQRGVGFPRVKGAAVDIGAVEH